MRKMASVLDEESAKCVNRVKCLSVRLMMILVLSAELVLNIKVLLAKSLYEQMEGLMRSGKENEHLADLEIP